MLSKVKQKAPQANRWIKFTHTKRTNFSYYNENGATQNVRLQDVY